MALKATQLLESIKAIVGGNGIFEDDARGVGPIIRPESSDQVSKILSLCNDTGQSIVPIGGNSTMVQGTHRGQGELALSLERMSMIEEIDTESRTMTVQAGAKLQDVQEAAAKSGFFYPLDIGARGSATVGGNIATNAGGNRVIRYGMTREQIVALEAVLADGTIIPMQGKALKNNTGYDLKHLFISSEGTLGIVTKAVLRLRTLPVSQCCGWVSVPDFESLTKLLTFVEGSSEGMLSSFEVLWAEYYEFITGPTCPHSPPLPYGDPYTVLIETQGMHQKENTTSFEVMLSEAFSKGLISDAVIAKNVAERDKLWAIRDDVNQAIQLAPIWAFDVSLAINEMEDYVNDVKNALNERWSKNSLFTYGHLGDGNLHLLPSVGDGSDETKFAIEKIIYEGIRKRNGSISAEHGIGHHKTAWLSYTRTSVEIALMKKIKQTFDPQNILNPGKIFGEDTCTILTE